MKKWLVLSVVLAASATGLSGCASQKSYHELQREALNQDEKKECTVKDTMGDIIYKSSIETMRTAFNCGLTML
jgi:hypothetical protein